MKRVTGPGRPRPFNLAAGADDAAFEGQPGFDQQSHGDCGGVPAARGETREQRLLSGRVVLVERLRIKLAGEGLDLRFVDRMGAAGEALADVKIVKIELGRWSWIFRERHGCLVVFDD
jgi:hypothetical protein